MNIDARTADIVIEALRIGEVPSDGQDAIATGIDAQVDALLKELPRVAEGRGRARFVRGDFGAGKTFFLRLLAARARSQGFATAYVRIAYPEVPLHKPVAVYRAAAADLGVAERPTGALRHVLDQWLYKVCERVENPPAGQGTSPDDEGYDTAVEADVRRALGPVSDASPAFAQALAAYATASMAGEDDLARALLQWLGGDPKVAATAKRRAHLVGQLDATDVLPMLRGISTVVTQAGYKGLVLLVDEVERLVRLPRADARQGGLELLQNWLGALTAGELRSVLVVVAGTSTFFDSPRGVRALEPLQQRIGVLDDGPFPDLDAVQIALPTFDQDRLVRVGQHVRKLYEVRWPATLGRCNDEFLARLAAEVSGAFGGRIATTPRRYLRELIGVLGRCLHHPTFDPHRDFKFRIGVNDPDLSDVERAAVEGRDAAEAERELLPDGTFDL